MPKFENNRWISVVGRGSVKYLFIFAVFLLCASGAYASSGYEQTVRMWRTVEANVDPHRLELQALYAEAERQVGADKSKMQQAFSRRLQEKYPGSQFVSGIGYAKVNSYTTVYFDSSWNITGLIQIFGSLRKHYEFRRHQLDLSNGSNHIVLFVDPDHPEQSKYIGATIPAITATASDIWARRQGGRPVSDPFVYLLNDVYTYRLAAEGARMDTLAEELMSDPGRRQSVLNAALQLYTSPVKAQARPVLSQETRPKSVLADAIRPEQMLETIVRPLKPFLWMFVALVVLVMVLKFLSLNALRKTIKRNTGYLRDVVGDYASRGTLHTPAEQAFHKVLDQVIDHTRYQLHSKVRLADLITAPGKSHAAFNRIKAKHVDFVVSERGSSRIIGVIELDDSSHNLIDRIARDRFVDQALRQAGIPILHVPCRKTYSQTDLEHRLVTTFGVSPRTFSMGRVGV